MNTPQNNRRNKKDDNNKKKRVEFHLTLSDKN